MQQRASSRKYGNTLGWILIIGVAVALGGPVAPEGRASEPVFKMGYVDMTRLFSEYHETRTKSAEFEAKLNEEQTRLDKKAEPVKEMKEQLDDESNSLSKEERRELEQEFKQALSKIQLDRRLIEEQLQREKEDLEKDILRKLRERIREFGTKEGYSIILRKSMLLHSTPDFDLTDQLLDFVNKDEES